MATEQRLISASATVEAFTRWLTSRYDGRMPCDIVAKIPTVDARPVVHGEWAQIGYDEAMGRITCSNCKEYWNICDNDTETFNYCPNCGTDMRGADNGL